MTVSGALPVGLLPTAAPVPAAARVPTTATGAAGAAASTGSTATSSEAAATASAARSFERVLLEQLTTQLAATAAPEDDASAATSAYRDMLPGAMAEALSAAGGIGLAAQFSAATGTAPTDAAPSPSATTTGSTT